MLNLTLDYDVKKRTLIEPDYCCLNYDGSSTILMGRLMLFDNYNPFKEVFDNNDKIKMYVTNGSQLSLANADIVANQA